MTRGRKPLRPRRLVDPLRQAARRMREGVATEAEWAMLAGAINVAKAIKGKGVVRGLAEHFASAEAALDAISRRALASGAWQATALYYQELEHVNTLVDLHEYQLGQLSYGERRLAIRTATAVVLSSGGRALSAEQVQESLL